MKALICLTRVWPAGDTDTATVTATVTGHGTTGILGYGLRVTGYGLRVTGSSGLPDSQNGDQAINDTSKTQAARPKQKPPPTALRCLTTATATSDLQRLPHIHFPSLKIPAPH